MAETWSVKELLQAGWSEADLDWETGGRSGRRRLPRAATLLWQRTTRARPFASRARASSRSIPRLGTALANFGLCLDDSGGKDGGTRLFRDALDVWRASGPWIARMDAPRMARSSLFHMRMELRHRETYRARWQITLAGDGRRGEGAARNSQVLARRSWPEARPRPWRDGGVNALRCSTTRAS